MITSGASSLELKFEVFINDAPFDFTSIQRVNIELEENKHNLATLDIAGLPPQYLTSYIDKPIIIRTSLGQQREYTFIGYVVYLEPESVTKHGLVNRSPFQLTRVYCFGSSYPMRGRKARAWNSYTLPQLAKELAENYNLTVSVPNDPYVFPRLSQSGKSDWGILVDAANYLGYRVITRGIHIDIWDPYTSLSHMGRASIYAMSGVGGRIQAEPGQIIKFKGIVGAATDPSHVNKNNVYSLIDSEVVNLNLSESSGYGSAVEAIFDGTVAENSQSIEQGKAILRRMDRTYFPYTAFVDVVGDPAIQPGMVVDLTRYDSAIDGLWLVKAVRHEMFRGSAMSYLTLVKDSNYTEDIGIIQRVSPLPKLFDPVIKNGRWVTTKELIDVYR